MLSHPTATRLAPAMGAAALGVAALLLIGHASADAYRTLRQVQHHARLNEESTQVDATTLAKERQAILALWQAVFTHPIA